MTALYEPEQITHDDIAHYRDVEQSVPKQSLNEIKAQAIEEMIKECTVKVSIPAFAYGGCADFKGLILVQDAEQYANKLRGEK